MSVNKKKDRGKKRVVRVESAGQAHIKATFNNVIVTITNKAGQVISWSSSGKMGFKGSKKSTPYAANMVATDCMKVAQDEGMREVDIFVKGAGSGREAAARAIHSLGVQVNSIKDVTPLPHNGCRPPKTRRP